MGPHDSSVQDMTVYLDGKPIATGTATIELPEITPAENYEAVEKFVNLYGSMTLEWGFRLPKSLRCHSRKRFIKLLMSRGCPRNFAGELAGIVARSQGRGSLAQTYQSAVLNTLPLMRFIAKPPKA